MIRIITVEREFGSDGGAIAAALASRRGWTLWDQLLTDEIARRMDCDRRRAVEEHAERVDPAYYRTGLLQTTDHQAACVDMADRIVFSSWEGRR